MGMNFSPMYQPVSTKTIKADGDLNVNPYDLLATDVKCDTVEADEFVGGVGNFSSMVMPTLSYEGFTTYTPVSDYSGLANEMEGLTIFSSPYPVSGKVSAAKGGGEVGRVYLVLNTTSGVSKTLLSTTQTEYDVENVLSVCVVYKFVTRYRQCMYGMYRIPVPEPQ